MLNELENKIRKAIPELNEFGVFIQLNHVLEYVYMHTDYVLFGDKLFFSIKDFQDFKNYIVINLKSNLLSEQSEELIKYINEL